MICEARLVTCSYNNRTCDDYKNGHLDLLDEICYTVGIIVLNKQRVQKGLGKASKTLQI